ncbi:MAG: hypothetical protein PHI65_07180 [Firmicutes bacterium]|nr:hypothetical protein [Bacillota bacterium]MDD4264244.1 hypothetical protein [Bacillota bacterium]
MTKKKQKLNQKETPFISSIRGYVKKGIVPFHTPGHIQGRGISKSFADLFNNPLLYDLAEVEHPSSHHDYEVARREAEKLLADLYQVERSFFLINGTTEGLHALLIAFFSDKGKKKTVLLPRNSHRSIVDGLILTGAKPIWVYPEIDTQFGLATVCKTSNWNKPRHIDGAFHLYPNYYGLCQNLEEQVVEGVFNLVDEAHGPHLKFSERLPKTALDFDITASVQSAHKILPALTQSSWLHVKNKKDVLAIERALGLVESTSPNFLLWASLDGARAQEANNPGRWDKALDRVLHLRDELKKIPEVSVFEPDGNHPEIFSYDPFKLVVSSSKVGLNGFEFRDELRKRGIMPELAEANFVLFIITPSHTDQDLELLKWACKDIVGNRKQRELSTQAFFYPNLKAHLTPRQAFFAENKRVALQEARGLISAEMIVPYPPGIPLIMPGEEITKEVVELTQYYRDLGTKLRGLEDQNAEYIRVVF